MNRESQSREDSTNYPKNNTPPLSNKLTPEEEARFKKMSEGALKSLNEST